jgi:ATP-dependent DNA helicase RecG
VRLYRGQKQLTSPEYEIVSGELDESLTHTGRIVPVYPLTAGISQRMMRRIVKAALDKSLPEIRENLPAEIRSSMNFPPRREAFLQIHYPDDEESLRSSRNRFKFEEVFFLHLLLKERRRSVTEGRPRPALPGPHDLMERFIDRLPFELTGAQERVLGEITRDVESTRGLGRLVQGDVGSGKTVIGIAALMMAIGGKMQGAFMAPTEILAQQHYRNIRTALEGLTVDSALLIGSMKRSEKEQVHKGIESGEIDLVVGTHALIQEGIRFRQLGLAVIDEQHRFGVKQRGRLGQGNMLPHFLVMTATPIPRSLAQTVYGDLDLSMIDELPIGSRHVRTEIVGAEGREGVYAEVRDAFRAGRQAFILYPLIEESERSDLLAATEAFERLQREDLAGFPLGILHGRMSFEEKSRAIEMFRAGGILGLITTTVIEVGVDIPNASILVINNPERFGLAQLHQLRGRVGRGGDEGACYLVLGESSSARSEERLRFFAQTDDGFRIAEEDLRLRGPGEIWGFRQSGYPAFRLLNPSTDHELVQISWELTDEIIASDPTLEKAQNRVAADYFHTYYKPRMELAEIG